MENSNWDQTRPDPDMVYYKPANWNGTDFIFAFSRQRPHDEFLKDGMEVMTDEEVIDYLQRAYAPDPSAVEAKLRDEEYSKIAEILLMIEDADPDAPPGTIDDWRQYRIALRRWKEGAGGWPDSAHRPARPA